MGSVGSDREGLAILMADGDEVYEDDLNQVRRRLDAALRQLVADLGGPGLFVSRPMEITVGR